jgi:Family of unknown function (DUF5357)
MKKFFEEIRTLLFPKDAASWQTLIWLSVLSVVMGGLATAPVQNIISSCGWVFLILGVWWFTYDEPVKKALTWKRFNKLFIGPWIVGALICLALFGGWGWGQTPTAPMLITWPIISAMIAVIPKFVKSDPDRKTPIFVLPKGDPWKDIVLLFLINFLLSCWFQFYFVLQGWLEAYPSLLSDNFSNSAFVTDLRPRVQRDSKGKLLLNRVEEVLKEQLDGKPWPEVERWLKDLNQQLPDLDTSARGKLPFAESAWWTVDGKVLPNATYNLQLRALWRGPSSQPKGYAVTTNCRITPGYKRETPPELKFTSPAPPAKAVVPPRSTLAIVKCTAPVQEGTKPDSGRQGIWQ